MLERQTGARTRDPELGKLMLYQLSYCRISCANIMVLAGIIGNIVEFFCVCQGGKQVSSLLKV